MHLVTTTDGTINFVPRSSLRSSGPEEVSLIVYITNSETRSTTAVTEFAIIGNNMWTVVPVYAFVEGCNYSFKIHYNDQEIYKGLIFCTNKNTNPFSYNNYTTYNAKDNEYIYR